MHSTPFVAFFAGELARPPVISFVMGIPSPDQLLMVATKGTR
jgi:hypothetical protein